MVLFSYSIIGDNMKELVIIDAGHGGMDSGAVGNGLEEKDLNLEVSKYIYDRLQELGIPAMLTRIDDEYLPKDKRIQRIQNMMNYQDAILISNHMNAGGGEGAEVVYSLKNNKDFAELVLEKIGEKGQIKRKIYQRRLPENPNLDYYYILRESNVKEPILIEYGFIDNKMDANKLNEYLEEYGEAVVEAITTYLGIPYQEIISQKEYIVQRGDTLYSIGEKFHISVDELKRINHLTSNLLKIGQVLMLEENVPNEYYVVQKGDTLYSISKNNNVSIEDIIEANNLQSSNLQIGQELYIPIQQEEIVLPEEFDMIQVQKGDSLWLISQKYNITVPDLIEINQLKDLNLKVGDSLLVPKQNLYQVQKGDTLWSIAKKNNISVEQLKQLNDLQDNLLIIGQVLKTK